MATVKNNIVTQGLSGMLGKTIVFRQVGDRTIVTTPPSHKSELSSAQKAQRGKFQEATLYAKGEMTDPASKAEYQVKADDFDIKNAYTIAVADFLNAPDIKEVDLNGYAGKVGDKIKITATDDFKVMAVVVSITNPDGSLVESGNAIQQSNVNEWMYTATSNNMDIHGDKITIKAMDKPGNVTTDVETIA